MWRNWQTRYFEVVVPQGVQVQVLPCAPKSIQPPAVKRFIMKTTLFLLLLSAVLLTGCARRYVITLSNGTRLTAVGKPQFQDGQYFFKDASGRTGSLPAGRVREIAPASMAREKDSQFIK